jgi:replicative DNA helicase
MSHAPNTMGVRFLRSVIANNSVSLFRGTADRTLFLDDELPAFDAVASHVTAYGKLPSLAALALAGVTFSQDATQQETPNYFSDQLRARASYNAINGRFPSLADALKTKNISTAVTVLREMLSEASSKTGANDYSSLQIEAQRVKADYQFAKMHPGLRGVTLRWPTLNEATNGAMGGDLIVVAGRPGMGKSWMMLEMALAAHYTGRTVAFASMEMSLMQISRRMLGAMTGINPNDIRAGNLSTWAEDDLTNKISELAEDTPIHLFRGDMKKNVSGIEQMMDEFDPEILFVDAAYLLSPAARQKNGISRWESISEVVRELKQLALRKDKPIVISVQFNRNQKNKGKKDDEGVAPDLGDIAGSDSIPQDASVVLGVSSWKAPFADTRRVVHVMKNREGETPRIGINFRFSPVNFDEIPFDEEAPAPIADTSWML